MTIESLAFGGDGVGRLADGRVVFVPGAAPGDRLRLRITREQRSFCRAEATELLEAGGSRQEPPCPLAGECGGCQWQQVTYAGQAAAKQAFVEDLGRRLGLAPSPLVEARRPLGYRRRVRLQLRVERSGEVTLGFFRPRTRQVLEVRECPLLDEPLGRAMALFRQRLRDPGRPAAGTLSLVGSRRTGEVHFSLRLDPGVRIPGGTLEELARCAPLAGGAWSQERRVRRLGAEAIDLDQEEEPGEALWGSALAFCQANARQEQRLRRLVDEALPAGGAPHVLELFCGIGTLTRTLARRCETLRAVESSPEAVGLLRRNCEGLPASLETVRRPAAEALGDLRRRLDLVLLDPPREGARELMAWLASSQARRIIYVSCDPMTLARDAAILTGAGYAPVSLVGLDMMPQTFHLELLLVLERG